MQKESPRITRTDANARLGLLLAEAGSESLEGVGPVPQSIPMLPASIRIIRPTHGR